jgi:hypothetical protein
MNTKRAMRVAILGLVVLVAGLLAVPALAAGPSVGSIYTSVNPATAGQDVSFTVVVEGTFQSPLGFVQLFDGLSPLGPPLLLSPDFDSLLGGPHIIPTDHSTATVLTRSFSPGTHLITLDYTGDGPLGNLPIFGGGVISLVVTGSPSTTSVSSSANPSVFGQSVTFTASASSSGSPAAGSVQFKADGANLGSPQPVDASGNAFVSVSTLSVGSHPVSADFTSSDANVFASSGSLGGGQVVNAADTSTAVSSSVNPSEFGGGVTFTSSTTVSSPGSGTPGGTVQFHDNGANLGPPQNVGGSGEASISTSSLSVGSHSISASFTSGDASFNDSAGSTNQTVNRAATVLSYDGAVTADFDDPAALSARLTRASGSSAVAGQSVTLSMGAESCSAETDPTGEAACTITPSEPAGPQTVTAVFAGDANYQQSSDSKPFSVTKEQTVTVYTGAVAIAQGNPVNLAARLLEDGIKPIAGRTLTLTLGTGFGSQHCVTGPTDAAGNGKCTLLSVSVAQGPQPVRADFAGDGYYLPSADATKSVIVFAFLNRGIFVIGDQTAAAAPPIVNFWSDQWAKLNALTGGTAPSSFKGFGEYTASKPPACGGTWRSSPGSSSSPDDDDLPAYMAVAVSSSITKSGSTISGNITTIVVVATAHGNGWDHRYAGSGSVVATYC